MCGNFTGELGCSEKPRIADELILNFKPSGGLVVVNVSSLRCDCRIFRLADFSLSFTPQELRIRCYTALVGTGIYWRSSSALFTLTITCHFSSPPKKGPTPNFSISHCSALIQWLITLQVRTTRGSESHSLTSAVTKESGDVLPPQNKSKTCRRRSAEGAIQLDRDEKLNGSKSTSIQMD